MCDGVADNGNVAASQLRRFRFDLQLELALWVLSGFTLTFIFIALIRSDVPKSLSINRSIPVG